ncbi:MAG: glycerophosphoryl diester phosphodiesterase membrane domain-containing protein [Thermoleophilia bacterium]|nr:glycerophosphoryl diester phosphodiesterase membrane domain-containing protein [Thermoleophilia bacterium]
MADHCFYCGGEVAAGPGFCPRCGAPVATGPQQATWTPSPVAYGPATGGPRPIESIVASGYKLDIGAILSDGWRLFTSNVGGFLGFALLGGLLGFLLGITIVGMLFLVPLLAGFYVVPLLMLKGRTPVFGDFFGGFRQLGSLVALGVVMGLLILLGTILLILPGIYLSIAWTWAIPLIVDRRMGFWEAMSASMKVVNKNFWETLLLVLLVGVINAAGGIVFVGYLVTIPLGYCILVAAYRDIFGLDLRT